MALRGSGTQQVTLTVQDDGVGLPGDMDIEKSPSLGLRLLQMLARRLSSSVEIEKDNGTRFIITFKATKYESDHYTDR